MSEATKKAVLVSLEEWNAIHDELWKTLTVPANSELSADEFQAAAQNIQFRPLE